MAVEDAFGLVVQDMAAWRFDSAMQRIEDSRSFLDDSDALIADAERAGLTVPQRLRDRYRTYGGGADAREELDAERAVVDGCKCGEGCPSCVGPTVELGERAKRSTRRLLELMLGEQ